MKKNTNYFRLIGDINENPILINVKNKVVAPVARFLIKFGLSPTALNFLGLGFGVAAALIISQGYFSLALIFLILSGLADALDGSVARELGIDSKFGAFLDSVLDRYVDTCVLLGIAAYYMNVGNNILVTVTFAAVVGAVITSYTAARAAALGIQRYIGFLGRPQRIILLFIGVGFPEALPVIMWILAILGNITAIHRSIFYAKELLHVS